LARLKEFGDSICDEVLHKVVVEGREKMSFYLKAGENEDPTFFKIPLLIRQDLLRLISLLADIERAEDREISALSVITREVFDGALLIAALSSASLLTTLSEDSPNAKQETPLLLLRYVIEAKQEEIKTSRNSKEINIRVFLL